MAKTTVAAELEIVLDSSSDEDDGGSEPEGFDSSEEEEEEEEEDWDKKDPCEDGEDSQQPEAPSLPATVSRSTADQGPAKRTRRGVLPTQPIAAHAPSPDQQPIAAQQPSPDQQPIAAQQPSPDPQPIAAQQPAPLSWKTDKDPDTAPPVPSFKPARTPGPQLNPRWKYQPFDLFKLFFSPQTVQTICTNTNKQAARQKGQGKKYKWVDLTVEDFYKYMGLVLYMALLKLGTVLDYWRQDHFLSVPLPAQVMTRHRYRTISWNLHLSAPEDDVQNDGNKGTPDHDRMFRLKPLMDDIKTACMSYYHPHTYLAVDERKLHSKAKTVITLHMKDRPTKWGFKLFALTDSRNGYTVDFSVYTGKSDICSGHGLAYDVVTSLVQAGYLGTGYHIYMDNFYTSPKLFKALHALKFAACGTYRESQDCPRTQTNALTAKSPRGSLRWIREGPLLFVKWMDNREVSVCSTIHEAYSGSMVRRKRRQKDGSWARVETPCPTPVAEYNIHMGGVHLSDQLIHHYSAKHKTMRWYRSLFYHFLDIATTNSYILHKEICVSKKRRPMTRRAFMGELSAELCGKPLHTQPARGPASHLPVSIAADPKSSGIRQKATTGRRRCEHCHTQGLRKDTPWKCKQCDVCLCLLLDRNCFEAWHEVEREVEVED